MLLTYPGPSEAVDIASCGIRAERGAPVEVPDVIADRLIEQGWLTGGAKEQTVAEVLAEVGDDPEKAALALAIENDRPEPRSSLVKKLTALIPNQEA